VATAGVGNYNARQLNTFLSARQMQVSPFVNDTYQGFSGVTPIADLSTAMEIIHAYFTAPRKDEEAFNLLIGRSKESLASKGNAPAQVFSDTVNLVLGNYHMRRRPQSISNIDAIKLDRAYAIFKERFADASGFTFVFVGNINLETIKPLLEKYLGSLPSKGRQEKASDLGINTPAGRIAKTVYKGDVQKSSVILTYSGPFVYSFENTMKMDAVADALKINLTKRLRDEEGGTYTPNVQMNMSKYLKQRFSLRISFDCAVQNVDKLIASAQDELNKIRTSGPSAENLQKFKATAQVELQNGSTNNGFWLDYLAGKVMNKEPLVPLSDYNAALNQITVQSVRAAATTYIQDKNYIRLVLMPEKTNH